MNCSKLILATALLISASSFAKPVVIGEPSKGTPVTTLKDGKSKVEITTTGITVDDGEEDKDTAGDDSKTASGSLDIAADKDGNVKINKGRGIQVRAEHNGEQLEDIVVPVAFFLFILTAILGAKYISSRNEQRRLDLLKMMVEKGQPVPENVMNSILTPQSAPESDDDRNTYKRYRNAYGFSIAGVLLLFFALLNHSYDGGMMITGLIFVCLGVGGLAAIYLPKQRAGAINNDKA